MLKPNPALAIRHCTGSTLPTFKGQRRDVTAKCGSPGRVPREQVNVLATLRDGNRSPDEVTLPPRSACWGDHPLRLLHGLEKTRPRWMQAGSPQRISADTAGCWFQIGPFSSNGCRSFKGKEEGGARRETNYAIPMTPRQTHGGSVQRMVAAVIEGQGTARRLSASVVYVAVPKRTFKAAMQLKGDSSLPARPCSIGSAVSSRAPQGCDCPRHRSRPTCQGIGDVKGKLRFPGGTHSVATPSVRPQNLQTIGLV